MAQTIVFVAKTLDQAAKTHDEAAQTNDSLAQTIVFVAKTLDQAAKTHDEAASSQGLDPICGDVAVIFETSCWTTDVSPCCACKMLKLPEFAIQS
ncbi:hypothetical protein [Mariniblastus fucicola]|uniref:hypothetical protein n=1 Tax=Mariniblastus fucicola TaxID=980251 RepID=UPI0011E002EC|nr:hypothetical protein [Mariniblastus fucicola]